MINQFSRRIATVLIDNSECGTVDHILHTQFLTDRLDKGSLTGPHRTIEGKDRTIIPAINSLAASWILSKLSIFSMLIAFVFTVYMDCKVRDIYDIRNFSAYYHFGSIVINGTNISSIEIPPCWNVFL